MPEILAISPNSPDWDKVLNHYYNSISEPINPGGRKLEIGMMYDINSIEKSKYIKQYNETAKEVNRFKSDEDLEKYFNDLLTEVNESTTREITKANTIKNDRDRETRLNMIYKLKWDKIVSIESQRYKYATPIDVIDFVLYRYCLIHSQVANEFALVNNSNNIRFYLYSEDEIKKQKDDAFKIERDRMIAFTDVIKQGDTVDDILYALGKGSGISKMDTTSKHVLLNTISAENPTKFIITTKNTNLKSIGKIEKYIESAILRRLEGSQVIVDGTDSTIIIGDNIEEALTFFADDKNKGLVSEYATRYKSLPQ
jgi:hypothetical protein